MLWKANTPNWSQHPLNWPLVLSLAQETSVTREKRELLKRVTRVICPYCSWSLEPSWRWEGYDMTHQESKNHLPASFSSAILRVCCGSCSNTNLTQSGLLTLLHTHTRGLTFLLVRTNTSTQLTSMTLHAGADLEGGFGGGYNPPFWSRFLFLMLIQTILSQWWI